jgi:ribosomal protein L28
MAKVAHAMSKTRNRNHIPLISQLRTLNRKRPLKLNVSALAQEFI